jgi:cell division protein FtsW (lipid II flippase)
LRFNRFPLLALHPSERNRRIEFFLVACASAFLALNALALSLAPGVQGGDALLHEGSLQILIPFFTWVAAVWIGHFLLNRFLPLRDPFLFPTSMFLAGWGLMVIFRISPSFAMRQMIWIALAVAVILGIARFSSLLASFRKYRYLVALAALVLLVCTFVFGTSAQPDGEKLWIGLGGVFFQPSEMLKWVLPGFAAFSFDPRILQRTPSLRRGMIVFSMGLIYTLLVFLQHDTGTALILALAIAIMFYLAFGKGWIPLSAVALILLAGIIGYGANNIVHARVDTWWNPWWDASNTSYQVVQSLIAVASGGIIGRGPGLGFPQLVPVTISDFLFTALTEEYGLVGALGCLALLAIWVMRGFRIAAQSADRGFGLLAGGMSALIGLQAIMIAGGGVRLLPLTGVTFPWMSYGGSSLLACAISLGLLLVISSQPTRSDSEIRFPVRRLALIFLGCLGALAFMLAWWGVYRSPVLRARTDNIRRILHDQTVARGNLYDRNGNPLAFTTGTAGGFARTYPNPEAAPITGYSSQRYGQGGMEAALDPWLRGETSYTEFESWWSETVLGVPLRGLGARLTVDASLQQTAGGLLGNHKGAIVVLRAKSGDILALASHPTYQPGSVDQDWSALLDDPASPLLNRATQGQYAPETAILPFLAAQAFANNWAPEESNLCHWDLDTLLHAHPGLAQTTIAQFRFWEAPAVDIPSAFTPPFEFPLDSSSQTAALIGRESLFISPLQMALAVSSLYNNGMEPAPRLVDQWETPNGGWTIAEAPGHPLATVNAEAGRKIAKWMAGSGYTRWPVCETNSPWSIFIDSSLADPVVVVVLLEEASANDSKIALTLLNVVAQ